MFEFNTVEVLQLYLYGLLRKKLEIPCGRVDRLKVCLTGKTGLPSVRHLDNSSKYLTLEVQLSVLGSIETLFLRIHLSMLWTFGLWLE